MEYEILKKHPVLPGSSKEIFEYIDTMETTPDRVPNDRP